ncbi:MAG: aryl-sulfate sulfotransferase [Dehalobacterium sp.]
MNKSSKKKVVSILIMVVAAFCMLQMAVIAAEEFSTALTPEQVAELSSDAWIAEQQSVEEAIYAEYEKGNYTLKDPLIKVDPFGAAPLTALVIFDTEEPTKVDLLVKGKSSKVDIKHSFTQYSTHHEIPVYGLYEDFNNTVTLTAYNEDGKKEQNNISIKTAPLADNGELDGQNARITVKDESEMVDGLTFTTTGWPMEYTQVVAYDANGDIRCVLPKTGTWTWGIRRLDNGNIYVTSFKHQRDMYYDPGFLEIDLMGKIHKEYLRNGVHHDVRKLANGNYLVVCEKAGRDTTEDYIVELDGKTGSKVREWDMKEILKMDNYVGNPAYNYNTHDWLHINSIWPVPGEDAILFSGRHQDGFFKINLAANNGKGELVWAMTAPDEDFSEEMSAKLLKPIGEIGKDFEYVWGQHAISMLPDGKIFVFDNGNGRSKDPDNLIDNNNNYSRAVIYLVDEKNMTVEQLWQYGKERGSELYSGFICDVDYLGPNHYLIDFGGIGGFSGTGKSFATIVEIKDNVVVWEMKLENTNKYRAERMQAYEFDKEYQLTKQPGVQLGELVTTE